MHSVDSDHAREDRAFPHQVEVAVPERRKMKDMLAWCMGKRYRTRQVSSSGATVMRWCFAEIDDATFFQATFGGTAPNASPAPSMERLRTKPGDWLRSGLLRR